MLRTLPLESLNVVVVGVVGTVGVDGGFTDEPGFTTIGFGCVVEPGLTIIGAGC